MTSVARSDERVWIPAVPMPFLGWWTDRCMCGRKFRGKNRRPAYELHYRREHAGKIASDGTSNDPLMQVTRAEAERIYAEVHGG